MKRVAAMTVIRGEGECVALMNNVVMKEMAKMKEVHRKEMLDMSYELQTLKTRNNERAAKEMADLRKHLNEKPSLWKRFVEEVEMAWCVFFATLMELGLIEYVGSGEQDI